MQGTRLVFSTERSDDWWWLMANGDVNAAKLLALAAQLPGWKDDVAATGDRPAGPPDTRRVGHHHGQRLGRAGGAALCAGVREDAGGRRRASTLGDASRTFDWSGATKKDGVASGAVDLPWPAAGTTGTLQVEQQGSGRPWATVRAVAAVPLRDPVAAGYRIKRTVTPVEQAVAGKWSRGDSYRVRLEVDAQADMTWVVVNDPVPTGATILGSGLGRDSQIATSGEKKSQATFTERTPGVVPRVLRLPAQGQRGGGVHGAAQQRRRVRAAAHARGGALRTRRIRRRTQCQGDRGSPPMSWIAMRMPPRVREWWIAGTLAVWSMACCCSEASMELPAGTPLTGQIAYQPAWKTAMAIMLARAAWFHRPLGERRWLVVALVFSAIGDFLLALQA